MQLLRSLLEQRLNGWQHLECWTAHFGWLDSISKWNDAIAFKWIERAAQFTPLFVARETEQSKARKKLLRTFRVSYSEFQIKLDEWPDIHRIVQSAFRIFYPVRFISKLSLLPLFARPFHTYLNDSMDFDGSNSTGQQSKIGKYSEVETA